jgi:MerR family transcriptional regulator, thiopeptide resistance regulator
MPLQDIKKILDKGNFDVLDALERHKNELLKRKIKLETIINTVDHTILHMKGMQPMSKNQLFEGFSDEQQTEYAQEAIEMYNPDIVKAANKKWKNYTTSEKQRIGEEGNQVYLGFLQAIDKGPESPEAQACVESWRRHMDYFWTPNDEQLWELAEGYNNDPRFKANFDKIHPNLAEFVREAVRVYLKTRSS